MGFTTLKKKQEKIKLPLHPTVTSQQMLTSDLAECCTIKIQQNQSYDAEVVTIKPTVNNIAIAKVFFCKRNQFKKTLNYEIDDLLQYLHNNEILAKSSSKYKDVSGPYFEAGYGTMAGSQSTSIRTSKADPKKKTSLVYKRSIKFTNEIEDYIYKVESRIRKQMINIFPEFTSNEYILQSFGLDKKLQKDIFKSYCYPQCNNNDVFPFPARAIRISGCRDNASNWFKKNQMTLEQQCIVTMQMLMLCNQLHQ